MAFSASLLLLDATEHSTETAARAYGLAVCGRLRCGATVDEAN